MPSILQTGRRAPGKTTIVAESIDDAIEKWLERVEAELIPWFVSEVSRRMMLDIVERSPVDTGMFVSHWEVSTGSPIVRGSNQRRWRNSRIGLRTMSGSTYVRRTRAALGGKDAQESYYGGERAKDAMLVKVNDFFRKNLLGVKIYLTNSLPYAFKLEYEDWSRQAPGGMIRYVLRRKEIYIRQVLAEMQ